MTWDLTAAPMLVNYYWSCLIDLGQAYNVFTASCLPSVSQSSHTLFKNENVM